MPCGTIKVTDVPTERKQDKIEEFNLDNPTSVTATEQPNGKWTIVAVFPPCPDELPQHKKYKHLA